MGEFKKIEQSHGIFYSNDYLYTLATPENEEMLSGSSGSPVLDAEGRLVIWYSYSKQIGWSQAEANEGIKAAAEGGLAPAQHGLVSLLESSVWTRLK